MPLEKQATNRVLILASLVIILASLKFASKVFIIIILTTIFASLLSPIVLTLQKKLPKIVALLITIILFIVSILLTFTILDNSFNELAVDFPIYEQKLYSLIDKINSTLQQYAIDLNVKSILSSLNFGSIFQITTKTAFGIGNFLQAS